jgi:integrase/recombinase XerD
MIKAEYTMAMPKKSQKTKVEEDFSQLLQKHGMNQLEGFLLSKFGMTRKMDETKEQKSSVASENPLSTMTLFEAKEIFIKSDAFKAISKSQETYESEVLVFLYYCGMPKKEEEQPSCKIRLLDVLTSTFLGDYLDKYKNVNTKSKKASCLRLFIRTVAESEYIKREKALQTVLKVTFRKDDTPRAFTEETIDEILSLVKIGLNGMRNYTIVQTLLNTGLRVAELRNIQIKDINFKKETIKVLPKKHDEPVQVQITSEALELLKTYIDFVYSHQKKTLNEYRYGELYIFSMNEGRTPIVSKTIQRLFQQAIEKVTTIPEREKYEYDGEIKGKKKHVYGPHSCRHTFALNLLEAGVDIYTICKLLNHRTVASTEKYLKLFDQQLKNAVEKNPILDAANLKNLKKFGK